MHNDGTISENNSDESGADMLRTIYPAFDEFKKDDILYYDQENYKITEKAKESNKKIIKDAILTKINLKDYIESKFKKYLENNVAQVPTGTIINQYCSYEKWCCHSTSNSLGDVYDWQGFRPNMVSDKTGFGNANLINNRAIYNRGFLLYPKDNYTPKTSDNIKELPPEFKRGYILCDGKPVEFTLSPSNIVGDESESSKKSLELFFDLFYTIGYYYVDNKEAAHNNCMGILQCIKDTDNSVETTTYKYIEESATNINGSGKKIKNRQKSADANVVYAIDMATILAFRAFDAEFNINKKTFNSKESALEWLKKQTIDEEYIFNSIIPKELESELPNDYYLYTNDSIDAGNSTIKINIGRQISKFTDNIPYYEYDEKTEKYILVKCRICDTAQVRDIAERFVKMGNAQLAGNDKNYFLNWSEYYIYSFPVPKLYSETYEGDEFLAKNLNKNEKEIAVFGNFIGSNGLMLTDSISIKCGKDDKIIENLDKTSHTFECNYRNNLGNEPHIHAIGKGHLKIELLLGADSYTGEWTPSIETFKPLSKKAIENATSSSVAAKQLYNTGTDTTKTTGYNYYYTKNANEAFSDPRFILKTDFRGTPKYTNKINAINSLMNNYILFESLDNSLEKINVINTFTGTLGKEWYNGDKFVWYGRTSEPIWLERDENASAVNNKFKYATSNIDSLINNSFVGYFRPESVKVLPLIKL